MDSARFERIQAMFLEATERPESERRSFLENECGGDTELMARVTAMLEADHAGDSWLDRGLSNVASQMLDDTAEAFDLTEVGPYRLKEMLGRGGMGVVYRADRIDTGTPVAIKFLLDAGMSPARREVFQREIRTLARLKHPWIARFHDANVLEDGTPWFVMEYVEGVQLTDYCRERGLSTGARVRLFRAVCEAVQYAYRQGFIHRDLKPSNILVENDGTPRLLDFGIAQQVQDPYDSEHPSPSLRFGSLEYAAPEWVRDGIVASFTDVYSLGVLFHEMLAAHRPAKGDEHLPRLPELGKPAWLDLDALCRKAMHPDAARRYQSVEELIRDVDHYLNCQPLEARAGGWSYRAGKFVRRHQRAVAAGSLAAAAIIGLIVFFTVRLARAKDAALAEAARTRRIQQLLVNLIGGGETVAAPSNDLRVVTILDRGAQEAGNLKADPDTQAQLYLTLGTLYEQLDSFDKADEMLQLALETRKASVGPESPKTVSAMVQLGLLRGDQNRFEDAERLLRQALAIARRKLAADDFTVLDAQSALGRVLAQSGANDQAIAMLEPLVRSEPVEESRLLMFVENLNALAVAQQHSEHIEMAESINRRALAIDRRLHGSAHPRVATDLSNIGTAEATLGRWTEAEKAYREAIRIRTAWYGPNHPETILMTSALGRTLAQEGRYAEADALLRQVLGQQEKIYGTAHPYLGFTLYALGSLANQQGNPKAAEEDLTRALSIYRPLYGDANSQTAKIEGELGKALLAEKQYGRAETAFLAALKVLNAPGATGNPAAGMLEAALGRALLRQQRYREAEPHLTAGYAALMQKPDTYAPQIADARADLADLYEALHQDAKAGEFRARR
ncbi:MAG: serine/threonine-protein kinase [Bryobacteraceae bacterium]|jgi:eukaryotic-like serine/threonine-protein kinase